MELFISRGFTDFNPRPPWGGRQADGQLTVSYSLRFQSTPSVGRATKILTASTLRCVISIHALRGEGDFLLLSVPRQKDLISIHALRGEGDTSSINVTIALIKDFNPRPPWGGRRARL